MTTFTLVNEAANRVLIQLDAIVRQESMEDMHHDTTIYDLARSNIIAINALLKLWCEDDKALAQLIRHGLAADCEFDYRKRLVQILNLLKDE